MTIFSGFLLASLVLCRHRICPPETYYTKYSHSLIRRTFSQLKVGTPPEATFDTRRLELGLIFQELGRQYLFATQTNMRDFEWGKKEAEDLFESLYSLLGDSDDLELNTIVLMKKPEDESRKLGPAATVYNVHDGQQRLVSLSLFLAALRDNLANWRGYGQEAEQVANMIFLPGDRRKDAVTRIELREKNGKQLKCILSKSDEQGNAVDNLKSILPPNKKSRDAYPTCDRRIFEVYTYFYDRISELKPETALDLLESFTGRTHLLLLIPSDTRTARNMVMGQGKGKNVEPVDEFKAIVCFNSIEKEQEQDHTLERWNQLCEDLGRETVQEACILMAQAERGKVVLENDEVNYMESFVKQYMTEQMCDGKAFFDEVVMPASHVLKELRKGNIELAGPDEDPPSLYFLDFATRENISMEIGVVVLPLLVLHRKRSIHDRPNKIEIEKHLRRIESIALWMLLGKSKRPQVRLERCLRILMFSRNGNNPELDMALCLSPEEKATILDGLDSVDFGSSSTYRPRGKAILERINEHKLVYESQHRPSKPVTKAALHLEHILPQKHKNVPGWETWDPEDAESWKHKLGNLALLNQKVNSKISNSPFEKKQESLRNSIYPITRDIARADRWSVTEVKENHEKIIDLAAKIWDLY